MPPALKKTLAVCLLVSSDAARPLEQLWTREVWKANPDKGKVSGSRLKLVTRMGIQKASGFLFCLSYLCRTEHRVRKPFCLTPDMVLVPPPLYLPLPHPCPHFTPTLPSTFSLPSGFLVILLMGKSAKAPLSCLLHRLQACEATLHKCWLPRERPMNTCRCSSLSFPGHSPWTYPSIIFFPKYNRIKKKKLKKNTQKFLCILFSS